MKNTLKRWYFEWLDTNMTKHMHNAVREELSKHNFKEDIEYWVKHYSIDNIQYTHFISAVADNSQLVEAIVQSINRKQIK